MSCRKGTLCIVHLQGTYINVIDVHHSLASSFNFLDYGFLLSLNLPNEVVIKCIILTSILMHCDVYLFVVIYACFNSYARTVISKGNSFLWCIRPSQIF